MSHATRPFQPHTTDTTPTGLMIARNAMRKRLWADDVFAHRWMCHPGKECPDGCSGEGTDWSRVALYQSEME